MAENKKKIFKLTDNPANMGRMGGRTFQYVHNGHTMNKHIINYDHANDDYHDMGNIIIIVISNISDRCHFY